jgi:predicted membrane protein
VIGVIILVSDKDSLFGVILIVVGGGNIIARYFHKSFYDVIYEYWPFLIIALGIFIVLKTFGSGKSNEQEIIEAEDYFLDAFSIFGNNDKYIKSKSFKGGKLTSLFGELKINLAESDIQESPQELDILTLFGASEILIPSDWEVILKTTTIFGGFSDERAKQKLDDDVNKKVLIVKGLILFGGGEIKS